MEDLLYTQGQDNMSGLHGYFEIVAQADVDDASLPALSAVGALSITGNLVLKATKRFGRLYVTIDSGMTEGSSVGVYDAKSQEWMLKGRYPRLDKGFYAWFRTIQNGPLVVLFTQSNTGKRYLMGLQNFDPTTTVLQLGRGVYLDAAEFKSGGAPADESGGTITFKWSCAHGPIEYNGTVDITP